MLQQMLDLDRHVVRDPRVRRVQPIDNAAGVRGAVEEIRIAEGDVPRARCHLVRDVGEDDSLLHDAELAVVDRHNRTVPAQMTAAAARLGVPGERARAVGVLQRGVTIERRQAAPIGDEEFQARDRSARRALHHGGHGGTNPNRFDLCVPCVLRGGELFTPHGGELSGDSR